MEYEKVNVLDSKFILKKPLVKMQRGASDVSRNSILCAGNNPSDSSNSFNVPITPGSWLDPNLIVHTKVKFTVTVTNTTNAVIAAGAPVLVPGLDITMSEYPFMCNVAGISSVNFNTKQVSQLDLSQYAKMLLKLGNVRKNQDKSLCPSCPEDSFAIVNDAFLTSANSAGTFNDGRDGFIPNGAWTFVSVTNNGLAPAGGIAAVNAGVAGSANFDVVIETYEPLLLPPFVYDSGKSSDEAIFGLSNLTINIANNASTAFRALRLTDTHPKSTADAANTATYGPITGFTMSNAGGANTGVMELIYKTYQTPYLKDFVIPSPVYTKHCWNFLTNYQNGSWGGTDPRPLGQLSNNIHIGNVVSVGMPSYIILWCDQLDNAYKPQENKYYYPINNLSIGLSNRQNILSGFDIRDLYNLSKDAGLNQTFLSYLGQVYNVPIPYVAANIAGQSIKPTVGGPVVLIPGVSFPLPADLATNSDGSFTFTFDAACRCYVADNLVQANLSIPRLCYMMIYDTWINIDTSNLNVDIARCPLTKADVTSLPAEVLPAEEFEGEEGGVLHHKDLMRRHGHHASYSHPRKINSRLKH